MRQRSAIVSEIQNAEAKLEGSMDQIKRIHYRRLGELFIQLRMTFPKGNKGDRECASFCDKQFPGIKARSREEYITYRNRIKRLPSSRELPPLTHKTRPNRDRNNEADRVYKRIVDEEAPEVKAFERRPEIDENELIQQLADKIIDTGYRILSVKMHPDKDGGSNEAMRNLNKAKKLLQDALIQVAAKLI